MERPRRLKGMVGWTMTIARGSGKGILRETEHSVLRMIRRIHESVPDSAWDNVPTDGARNYKHYLYGWPKDRG